ncbi:MAG: Wzz/FepE/Etk N-terminal domain-containing protein [Oscillospiraceae bacterium]
MEETLDLKELLGIIRSRIWLIVAGTVAGLLIAFGVSQFLIMPSYTAQALLYVNSSKQNSEAMNLNLNDINASQKMVNTYIVILKSREVLDDILAQSGLDYTREQLETMISYQAINNTEVLGIKVTSPNANDAAVIANTVAKVAPAALIRVTNAGSVELVSCAVPPNRQSGPNVTRNAMIGALLGMVLTVLLVVLQSMLDQHVHGEEDLTQHYNLPILGNIPTFEEIEKRGGSIHGHN